MKKAILTGLLVCTALLAFIPAACTSNKSSSATSTSSAAINPGTQQSINQMKAALGAMPKLNTGDKIGVLLITLANPFWVTMQKDYQALADTFGVKIDIYAAPTENDDQAQLNTLESMTAQNYKAIIFTPINQSNLIPGIVMANKKGIYMIDSGPSEDATSLTNAGGHVDAWININFAIQGQLAAQDIVKKLGTAGGKVVVIQGIPGAGQSDARTQGAENVFNSSPNIKVLPHQAGNWDRPTALTITQNLLQANPDLKAIYCCNDDMAMGALAALAAAGNKNVLVYGADFIQEASDAIAGGTMAGTTTFSEAALAQGGVIAALKLIQGMKDIPKGEVDLPIALITKDNLQQYVGFN